jgi:hypothetical protein
LAGKRKPSSQQKQKPREAARKPGGASAGGRISVRKGPEPNCFELVHPRCATERAEDIEDVQQMLDAGELEIAQDELRWLLEGCGDFIAAHRLLGEVALELGDLNLARGHFGYAFQLGEAALAAITPTGQAPYRYESNQAFLESAKGLAWSLRGLSKPEPAREVLARLLALDPEDPLGASALLAQLNSPVLIDPPSSPAS